MVKICTVYASLNLYNNTKTNHQYVCISRKCVETVYIDPKLSCLRILKSIMFHLIILPRVPITIENIPE